MVRVGASEPESGKGLITKDMLHFMIARDTMHQQQWLAALEDMGGLAASLPIPDSFPQSKEAQDFSYAFVNTFTEGVPPAHGRWSQGPAMDGRGEFSMVSAVPMGTEPQLAPPRPDSGAQTPQMQLGETAIPAREPLSRGTSEAGTRHRL